MNKNNETTDLTPEDYGQAMNHIGENLLKSLGTTIQALAPSLQNTEVVMQGLAAFLVNVLYQQFPQDENVRLQVLEHLTKIIKQHLTQATN